MRDLGRGKLTMFCCTQLFAHPEVFIFTLGESVRPGIPETRKSVPVIVWPAVGT